MTPITMTNIIIGRSVFMRAVMSIGVTNFVTSNNFKNRDGFLLFAWKSEKLSRLR
jgi:hypothetical protein